MGRPLVNTAVADRPALTGRQPADLERQAAFTILLAQPDERALRTRGHRRGHRLTQPGKQNRFITTWLPAVRVWTQREIGARAGVLDGWKPAEHRSWPLRLAQ